MVAFKACIGHGNVLDLLLAGLSRVRTSTAASTGRPDAFDDPTDVRLGGRPSADGEAVGRRDRRTEGADLPPTAGRGGRPPAAGAVLQGRPMGADSCPVCRRPSAIAVHLRRPPPQSIWGRPPVPSALYDSNFSFLHYVFTSLIAVT
jgi:hypothetical protein